MTGNKNIDHPTLPDFICEKLNSRLHVIGVILGILFSALLFYSSSTRTGYAVEASLIYGFCFIMTFTLSSLFHSCRVYPRRSKLKMLDRISIYFLIAGSYTPMIAFYLQNELGVTLLIILWVLAIAGIFFEMFLVKKYIFISVPFYLVMGCMFVFTANRFFAAMPQYVIVLILAGVLLYITGVIFYLRENWKYNHAVWHVFVLVAALCHYTAIFLTAASN